MTTVTAKLSWCKRLQVEARATGDLRCGDDCDSTTVPVVTSEPTAAADDDLHATMTIDELSAKAGTSVRTTRYYASLGIIPAPVRRGRVAYYGDHHLARLEMVRALQDHGFTLQAIERYLTSVPAGASTEELALQRAMLTSWTTEPPERLTRRQIDERAGRPLDAAELEALIAMSALEVDSSEYVVLPGFDLGLQMLELDLPMTSLTQATEAIDRHMSALADELTEILRTQVVRPYREQSISGETSRLEHTLPTLRRLVLEGVVVGFQRAANQVIQRSLSRR